MNDVTGLTDCEAIVKQCSNPKRGDYQANGIIPLAKRLKIYPQTLARMVIKKLKGIEEIINNIEVEVS